MYLNKAKAVSKFQFFFFFSFSKGCHQQNKAPDEKKQKKKRYLNAKKQIPEANKHH